MIESLAQRRHRSRWLAGLILLSLLGSPRPVAAAAQTAPTFMIEKILVQDARKRSAQIALAESLLKEGEGYSETELRDAVHRIIRLPFILDAHFSLEKGSERGRYELHIAVKETRRFFFGTEAMASRFDRPVQLEGLGPGGTLDNPFRAPSDQGITLLTTVGRRFFIGSYGLGFLAQDGSALQAGYTRYNLFDRQISFGIVVGAGCCNSEAFSLGLDPTFSLWDGFGSRTNVELNLGAPLRGNHALQARFRLLSLRSSNFGGNRTPVLDGRSNFSFFPFPSEFISVASRSLEHEELEVAWTLDTTDDPLLPSNGSLWRSGVAYASLAGPTEAQLSGFNRPTEVVASADSEAGLIRLFATRVQHWPLTRRLSLSLRGDLALGRSRLEELLLEPRGVDDRELVVERPIDLDLIELGARLQLATDLSASPEPSAFRDFRLEIGAEYRLEDTSGDPLPTANRADAFPPNLRRLSFDVGLVLRNRWGVFRGGLTWVNFDGNL